MPKYERAFKEELKQYILDANIRRLTGRETLEFLREKGIENINIDTIYRYKERLRIQAQQWISKLAKSHRAEYIAEYKKRIEEIVQAQKDLWVIVRDEKTYTRNKIEAYRTIIDSSMKLVELFDSLPLVAAIRDYQEYKALSGQTDSISSEQQQNTT